MWGNELSEKKEKIEAELKATKHLMESGWSLEDSLDFVRKIKKSSSLLSGENLEFDKLSKKVKKKLIQAMKEQWK